uniref:PX domain-containing protein n=1 Tax=Peronospora matthiolae TaxID=2874970 RepID=A0AAV1T8J7_9STRA
MNTTYELEKHVTVYALDVYLQATPRGSTQDNDDKRTSDHVQTEQASTSAEHRYSAFRELREHVGEAVAAPKDKSHPYWCPYCSRVREVLRRAVTAQRPGVFIDQLLHAARDMSYRSGCDPCGRFEAVSGLLSDFITPMTMMTKERMRSGTAI